MLGLLIKERSKKNSGKIWRQYLVSWGMHQYVGYYSLSQTVNRRPIVILCCSFITARGSNDNIVFSVVAKFIILH